MPFSLNIPFYAFKLHLISGEVLLLPMKDGEAMRIEESMYMLAGKYAEALQREVLDKGKYQAILSEYQQGTYQKAQIDVSFQASKDKISYPDFSIQFEYFYQELKGGIWAIIPVLGIECLSKSTEDIHQVLEEAVHLEFARKERLNALQKVVMTMWFESIELDQSEMNLRFFSQSELENLHEEQKEQILPQVAQTIQIQHKEVYGRKAELNQIAQTLRSQFSKNVLLVGASGVGKTALVWEIARQRKRRHIQAEIWETTASTLIKELTRDTGWQDNMVYLCKELSKRGDFLFVRNLMELFEVGRYEGNSVSMAEYMSNYLSRGEINMITECTEGELAKIELKSPQFLSFFTVIRIEEPKADLEEIILSKVNDLAKNRHINLDNEAIKETLRLNRRFTPYAGLPGKPIRFLESLLINQKNLRTEQHNHNISKSDVIQQFCEETGMPKFIVDPTIPMDVTQVKSFFQQNLFGQDQAVDAVVDLLAAVKASLTRTGKPIASFLFVGPTGVGKTEMAKILAQFMFGSRERMIRFDMSEYASAFAVMRMIGADYHSSGRLTSAVRREPFCVLLFDEIEKAHPNFYDLLLQLLSEGRLTDSQGKLVNFCSTIIIMTSNIGATQLQNNTIGWGNNTSSADVANYFETAVKKHFRPELYNRIDQVIPFVPLTRDVICFVVNRELALFKKREGIRFRKMDVQLDESVYEYFSQIGYESKYGARYLQRRLQEVFFIPLAKAINIEDYDDQLLVQVQAHDKQLSIQVEADPMGFDLMLEELNKINLTDYASELRRNIARFQEGHFYVRLLSEIKILERSKKRKKEKFWQNEDQVRAYTNLLQTQKDVSEMKAQIEQLEMDLSLSSLGQQSYASAWEKDVENWAKAYNELKIDFYARHHLGKNLGRVHLYGKNAQPIVQFYLDIFATKSYKVTGNLLWYDVDYYNEIIEIEEDGVLFNRSRQQYKRMPFLGHLTKPPREKDLLVGAEFIIMGKACQLFLEEEVGFQEWKIGDKDKRKYLVQVGGKDLDEQNTVHQPAFFKGVVFRRKISPEALEDKPYQIKKQVQKKDYTALILTALDSKFKGKIDAALM